MKDTCISFRLSPPYGQQLQEAAITAGISEHHLARKLLVADLENPSKAELTADLYEMSMDVEFLTGQVKELRQEVADLKVSMAAGFQLLLTYLGGAEAQEAIAATNPIFFEEE